MVLQSVITSIPSKVKVVQEVHESIFDRIVSDVKEYVLSKILYWFDASSFLNGFVNRYDCRYLSDENPRIYQEVYTKNSHKFNVCAGIFWDQVIRPFLYLVILLGKFLELLQDAVLIENNNNYHQPYIEDQIIFLQDGAPPHYTAVVREYFNGIYTFRGLEWPLIAPRITSSFTTCFFYRVTFKIRFMLPKRSLWKNCENELFFNVLT